MDVNMNNTMDKSMKNTLNENGHGYMNDTVADAIMHDPKSHYDAIIVGARCAGATMATYLARAGYRVLLVDRSFFPSDVISTHTIFNNTVDLLKELGVLDKLLTTNTPEVFGVRGRFNDVVLEGSMPAYNGESRNYCFRRTYFDQILLDHARQEPNVTALEGVRVNEVIWENGVAAGIRANDREGHTLAYRAKLIIGADGRNSTIRQAVGATNKMAVPTEYAYYYGYFSGLLCEEEPRFELFATDTYRAYIFPTSDEQHVVTACFPLVEQDWLEHFKQVPEQAMRAYMAAYFPGMEERFEPAVLTEPMKGILHFENHWYHGMGPGWALVGDALCFKDPSLGQGMHDAMFAARLLCDILAGEADWSTAWAHMAERYQTAVENEFMERFHAACYLTTVASETDRANDLAMQREVSQNPEAIEKFFGFYNYTAERADLVAVLESAKQL